MNCTVIPCSTNNGMGQAKEFFCLFIFHQTDSLGPRDKPRSDLEICSIFVELFELELRKFDSQLSMTGESQKVNLLGSHNFNL
jgi:hypothetical protein